MDLQFLLQHIVTVIGATLSAGGLWSYLEKRPKKKTDETQILLGLAQDRIVTLGKKYIKRGWIDYDEYNQFLTYLYLPYRNLEGISYAMRITEYTFVNFFAHAITTKIPIW